MTTRKRIGIWLDHSTAEFFNPLAKAKTHVISSDFTGEVKEEILRRSENSMHNKEQQMQEAFYEKIGEKIVKYEQVLLFGPTDAKKELFNFLRQNSHFKSIDIHVESLDSVSDNEKRAFVNHYFQ